MSIIPDDQQFSMDLLVGGTNDESQKKPRGVSYTRQFLLSLRDEDVCKKLPNLPTEFNDLFSRDTEDPSPERLRISGDFGLRRNDYSSSPPTRGEFGSNSRGSTHGRWEGRSGGWNDKDSADSSHSDRDPGERGRRSGLPSRRPWQPPEHDGLLGKGSFPKPSGLGAGPSSGPRPQPNDTYQLRRSNEPYHPPRPYKAEPYTRRDARDSLNDETFGTSDSTSEDRAEEERKRRASFELLRKEHQKVFQERQKSNPDLRKNDFDFTELLGESKDEKEHEVNNTPSVPGSTNHSFPSQSIAPRPLVPPGFASIVLERKQGDKPQAETSQNERSPLNPKGVDMVNGTSGITIGSSEMLVEGEAVRAYSTDTSEKAVNMPSSVGISTDTVNKDKSFENLFSISTAAEAQGYPIKTEQATMTLEHKKSLEDGPSILDKIFNTAVNLNSGDSSNITQKIVEKVEEKRSPQTVKSSKFAHLFLEEDNKPVEDTPSSRPPGGLLSLLQGADKLQSFETKAKGELSMDFPYQGHATTNIDKLSNTSASKPVTAAPPVLTCEDLEQSILSEASEINPPPLPLPVDQDFSAKKTKQRKASVDDQASQHLLSLLLRSGDPKSQDTVTETRLPPSVKASTAAGEADPGKSLTLENLFGSAFMNELQSIGEPVSGRAMVTDAPGVPLRSDRSMGELSQRNQTRPDGLPGGLQGLPGDGNFLGVFNPLDARHTHVKPQLDFMGQGSIIAQHQDHPPNHRFPPNMIHHRPPFQHSTTSGLPEFDRLPPHMMHMQDNLHLMQGFPGGGPPHHLSPNVIPELNPSQGFPFAHRQPNYGVPPGPQVNRVDHPASLHTLLGIHQMDPSKQSPAMGQAGGPNRQGSMGHELDLGFGYR